MADIPTHRLRAAPPPAGTNSASLPCPAARFVPFERAGIEQSIPARFEQQVVRHADRPALRSEADVLTYRELNGLANRIARALLAIQDAPEGVVALLIEPGPLQIAAIMGILKAGMIYVALDPQYPRPRLSYMLEDSTAALIITDAANCRLASDLALGRPVVRADELAVSLPASNPGVRLSPDAPAYIFYTSGTTGPPKGVVDSHRNVLHNIMRYTNGLQITADDRQSLLQSCSFSGSVSSLFSALLNGACLCSFDVRSRGVDQVAAWVSEEEISIYHSVPALFRQLFTGEERFPKLRAVRLEGDQASLRDVALFRERLAPECVLVNGLGTTETGLVRRFPMRRDTPLPTATVPIGYPVEDMEALLLDEAGDPVEPGAVGEIAIRSRYLAVGYWRKPELSRIAFAPDPSGADVRTYRTGDLGRMQLDGCLEYLGRKDAQPKLRGERIEVESLEAALLSIPHVREAVVQVKEDRSEEPCLVAYIVTGPGLPPTVSALRAALARTLPAAALPSHYVFFESLPLNENGKVDRRSLPLPDGRRPALDTPFVAPRTPVEQKLAEIWSEVLQLCPVGINDSFFELGGHSLRAFQVVTRLRAYFGVDLPLRAFFDAPTVACLAEAVTTGMAAAAEHEELARLLAGVEAQA